VIEMSASPPGDTSHPCNEPVGPPFDTMARVPRTSPGEVALAVALPLMVSALGILLLARTGLEVAILDRFFDADSGVWPLRDSWLFRQVLHDRGRDLIALVGGGALVLFLGGFVTPSLRPLRASCLFLVLAIALSTGSVGLMKSVSQVPCPWDSLRYGGRIPHLGPFASPPPGTEKGHCFPGAHAAGGFSLMASYFLFREHDRRKAWAGLFAGWLAGLGYGAVQVARGAHYPSHNFWACIVVWTVCCALYLGGFRGRLGARSERTPLPG